MKATIEQQTIISEVKTGKNIAVQALAGTGKSTTLRMIAKENPTKNFLALCFNSANAEESNKHPSKPDNIIYSTVHSLAYQATMKHPSYKAKLNSFLDYKDLNEPLIKSIIGNFPELGDKEKLEALFKVKRALLDVVTYYCRTDKTSIISYANSLLTSWFTVSDTEYYRKLELPAYSIEKLSEYCKEYWLALISPANKAKITHDVYLKLFELQNTRITSVYDKVNKCNFSVDCIMLDECLTNKHYVKTNKGNIKIDSLHRRVQSGELILAKSFNTSTETFEFKPIIGSLESHNREVLLIESEGLNKLHCTSNHMILTQRGYVPAGELQEGKDILYIENPKKQKTKYILNSDQLQIVLGSYLGDGSIQKQSLYNTYRISLTQGIKQEKYLKWKADCLNIDKLNLGISGYTNKNSILSGSSKVFLLEDSIDNLLANLNELGLAIWFMDDGSLAKSGNITISSNSFSYEQHEKLVAILKLNFNLYPTIGKEKSYFNLRFNKVESNKLLALINAYIHPDLSYKTNLNAPLSEYTLNPNFKEYGGNYIKKISKENITSVYDITVADNHNFVTSTSYYGNGIIVHNCQDSNPVTLSIFNNQTHLQKILVGDTNQQLYSWRGATGAMDNLQEYTLLPLVTSFRFNQRIADIANEVLSFNTDLRLIGAGTKKSIDSKAHLCKTNSAVLTNSIAYIESGLKVYTNIDLNDLFSKLWHLQSCYFNEKPKYPNKELSNITDKESLFEAMRYNDQLALINKLGEYLTKKYGNLTNAKKEITGKILTKQEGSDITISTIHRSKGMEWSEVTIDDDLIPDSESSPRDVQDWLSNFDNRCLLYVAITRAEVTINLPYYIAEYLAI